jgi:divinyl protochlorophyllide a 8-vinyl-reductase
MHTPDLATVASPPIGAVTGQVGRMCPSAVSQVAAVLDERVGEAPVRRLFEAAGLSRYLAGAPTTPVDEREVAALHRTLRHQLGPDCARAVARAAGRRTADRLLARHLPEPLRRLLAHLPRPLVARLLLLSFERDHWRLAGSGAFVAVYGRPIRLGLTNNPLCPDEHSKAPACDFVAGTVEQLCRSLITPRSSVSEIACKACGAPACIFEIEL